MAALLSHTASMTSFDDLDAEMVDRFFGASKFDLRTEMRAIFNARLLWLNPRAAAQSPRLRGLDPEARREFVLRSCAYLIAEATSGDVPAAGDKTTYAFADRYGGERIGVHGGSGRGVIINGFHVKGVGRTGLLGLDSNPMHTSGGAYLEEAVREAIFSEICAMEYPARAVPIVAIIDTGQNVVWDTSAGPKRESKVLIVRPCVLRPAHLERAVLYVSRDRWCGADDASRVAARVSALYDLMGTKAVAQALTTWASSWAEQMAYGFVHRLPHAGHSTSNLTMSGALLDFGACTAVPSWARFLLMMQDGQRFGPDFSEVIQALRSLIANIYFSTDVVAMSREEIAQASERVRHAFERRFILEVLKVSGLCDEDALALLDGDGHETLFRLAREAFVDPQRELFNLTKVPPVPRRGFDFASLHTPSCPVSLKGLQERVINRLGSDSIEAARARAAFIGRPRMQLYRESLKDRIYSAVETEHGTEDEQLKRIADFINIEIAAGRRDFGPLQRETIPVGFASGPSIYATLVRTAGQADVSALIDWADSNLCRALGLPAVEPGGPRHALACPRLGSDFIELAGATVVRVPCAIALG